MIAMQSISAITTDIIDPISNKEKVNSKHKDVRGAPRTWKMPAPPPQLPSFPLPHLKVPSVRLN